jgi:spore germination cell wall hydrolase CwlJ-like protein
MREYPKSHQNQHHAGTSFWDQRSSKDGRTGYGKGDNPSRMAFDTPADSRNYAKGSRPPMPVAYKHQMKPTQRFWDGGDVDAKDPADTPGSYAGDAWEGAQNVAGPPASDPMAPEAYGGGTGAVDTGPAPEASPPTSDPMAPESYGPAQQGVTDPMAPEAYAGARDVNPALADPANYTGSMQEHRASEKQNWEGPYQDYAVAHAMLGEARSQGPKGMAAVGNVVANRAAENYQDRGKLPSDQLTRSQFSYLGDQNYRAATKAMNTPQGDLAYSIAKDINAGKLPDNTNGALSYRGPGGFNSSFQSLAREYGTTKIGDHTFSEFDSDRAPHGDFPADYKAQDIK